MNVHCCDDMARQVVAECPVHPDPWQCPDALIGYLPQSDECGIRVHDGGSSLVLISFCPWCGARLPESRRDTSGRMNPIQHTPFAA